MQLSLTHPLVAAVVGLVLMAILLGGRRAWKALLESIRPEAKEFKYKREGWYSMPHTLVDWNDPPDPHHPPVPPTPRADQRSELGDGYLDANGEYQLGEDPANSASRSLSQCSFLPHHSSWFDPTLLSSQPHSSRILLRTCEVQPVPRIGNGWRDRERVRARVVWMPDIPVTAAHAAHLAHAFRGVGISFHTADYRGFGESEGERGMVRDWQQMVDDQLAFVIHVQATQITPAAAAAAGGSSKSPRSHQRSPPLLFLGGSGLGACVAILVAARMGVKDVAGMILLAPALQIPLTRKQQIVTNLLSKFLPRFRCIPLTDVQMLSRNLSVLVLLVQSAGAAVPRVKAPFQLQHGMKDLMWSIKGSKWMLKETICVSVHNKELKHILSAWHDLLHEHEGQAVMDNAVEWIDEKIRVRGLRDSLD